MLIFSFYILSLVFDESLLKFIYCPITKDELIYNEASNSLISKKLVDFSFKRKNILK